jgi:uncharacterized protein (TIGR03089 family)
MDITPSRTVVAAFEALVAADPARPLLTFYDDATGERTELSRATLANWVAKTANLLVDGCGLGVADLAAVHLPAHWQTAAVLLGCWSAGVSVDLGDTRGDRKSGPDGRPDEAPAAVAFASVDRLRDVTADETFALALAPLAGSFRPAPPSGTLDYVIEARGHGDQFVPAAAVRPDTVALADGTTHGDLVAAATSRSDAVGVRRGSRVLVDGDAYADPLDWLVVPLVVGASVVLCRHLDPARTQARLATERATRYGA